MKKLLKTTALIAVLGLMLGSCEKDVQNNQSGPDKKKSTITVTADLIIKGENEKEFLSALKSLVSASVNDDGCEEYRIVRELNAPSHFVAVERWESVEALVKHNQTAHFKKFLATTGTMFAKAPDIKVFNEVDFEKVVD